MMFLYCLLFYISCVNANHVPNVSVCETTFDDSRWEEINLNGNCELYTGTTTNRVSPCDKYFTVGIDYVYIPFSRLNGSQLELRDVVEDLGTAIALLPVQCNDIITRAVCYHLYLPCGNNSVYHLPRFVCPDACRYVSETICPVEWEQGRNVLQNQVYPKYRDDRSLQLPDCSDTDELVRFLNMTDDCCTNAGIALPSASQELPLITSSLIHSVNATHQATPSPTNNSISNTALIMIILAAIVTVIVTSMLTIIAVGLLICRKCKMKAEKPIARHRSIISNNYNLAGLTMKDGILDSNCDKKGSLDCQYKTPCQIKSAYLMRELSDSIISGSEVTLLELIGQGEFGIVHRALLSSKDTVPTAVAIKTLKGAFSENDIDEIIEETLKMKKFDHFNVLSLIGVCLDLTEAPCIVMPYMGEGSLLSYLKRERPRLNIAENASVDDDVVNNVTKQLLSMCLQVANGMEYLSKEKFVHRDLAARNCMMSVDGVIKVADFGLSEDVYAKNYFRLNVDDSSQKAQVKLPIKWMALESIHDGLFSEKTDVWSYGILCWEVFSLGKVPYPGLSPKEVVDFLDSGRRLDKPKNLACTKNIFTFITSCWNEKPDDRMSFTAIVFSVNELIKPFAQYMEFKQFFSQ